MVRNSYVKSACLGIIAGIRSMSAPALVSHHLADRNPARLTDSAFAWMDSAQVANVLTIAAAGEMVADKLPFIPARTSPGPLLARMVSGAMCGAAICAAEGKRVELGALAGGVSALGATFAIYHLRRKLDEVNRLPDVVLGLGEDALVVSGGMMVLSDGAPRW